MSNSASGETQQGFMASQVDEFFENPIRKTAEVARDAVIFAYGVHLVNEFGPRAKEALGRASAMIVKRFNNGE